MLVLAILVIGGLAVYETQVLGRQTSSSASSSAAADCVPIPGGTSAKSQAASTTFGAVTEWALPGSGRAPNAVAVAPDGSVWFAEQEVPGVAHLFPANGTLVEYAWPGYPTPTPPGCNFLASSSGMALWEGKVWAADEFANNGNGAVIGLDPRDGSFTKVNLTSDAAYPYWLAVGPHNTLWYTSDNITQDPARLGRIYPNLTVSVVNLVGVAKYYEPIEVDFVNSTFALVTTIDEVSNPETGACVCTGHVYSFDPSGSAEGANATLVGGDYPLILPTSLSFSDGTVWVTQHGASSVVGYDYATGVWTNYPTSLVRWSGTTLPYVIYANGSEVWFNEHYANKIADLHVASGTLTEYSESNPPASTAAGIQNDVSVALSGDGLWFTSLTGNYVGFVNASYAPGFAVVPPADNHLSVSPGGTVSVALKVTGSWLSPLGVNVSDSEDYASVPTGITITTSAQTVPSGAAPFTLGVQMSVGSTLAPGRYTVAVTVTDGGVQQTAYVFLDVE